MSDPLVASLRADTRRLARLAEQSAEVAERRRGTVKALLADGWSLGRIATEVGVTKGAIAKLAK